MRSLGLFVRSALALAMVGAMGCAGDAPAGEQVTEVTEGRQLLASVQLTGTHRVDFYEYDSGDLLVHEDLDVDKDFTDGHPTLAKMDTKGVKVADIYKALVGGRVEANVAARLGGADARALARAEAFKAERARAGAPELPSADELVGGQDFASESATPIEAREQLPGGVEKVTGAAACAEPAWDWQGDVGWFKNNFCGSSSKFCATEYTWASYGWYRGPTDFKATGFAQSHCASAHWLFQRKAYGGFPFYGIALATLADFDLAPRHLDTQHWTTTGDRAWYAKVSSNTGANRVALAIHHN
jgi:hypothetical protein